MEDVEEEEEEEEEDELVVVVVVVVVVVAAVPPPIFFFHFFEAHFHFFNFPLNFLHFRHARRYFLRAATAELNVLVPEEVVEEEEEEELELLDEKDTFRIIFFSLRRLTPGRCRFPLAAPAA